MESLLKEQEQIKSSSEVSTEGSVTDNEIKTTIKKKRVSFNDNFVEVIEVESYKNYNVIDKQKIIFNISNYKSPHIKIKNTDKKSTSINCIVF